MVELGICDKNLFTKDGQNPFALNSVEILQQKPTSLLTVFRLLSANSQIKNIPRGFSSWYIPSAKSSCIWCFFTAFSLNAFHHSAIPLLEISKTHLSFSPPAPHHPFVYMFSFWKGMPGNI